jgi:hypothetical protein
MGLLLAGCSVFGIRSGTEEPKYRVVARLGAVEIRDYAPRLAAQVTVPGDEISARSAGFRRLAGYIFGKNIAMTAPVAQSAATKIAMTAPVAQAGNEAGWTISFYMPAGYTLATLPKPTDSGISVVELPGEIAAVVRFSGIPGVSATARARRALLDGVQGSRWKPVGAPVEWFYDPPWTLPWARRNEVAVRVEGS